jgi:hypothetical protein
MYSNFGDGNNTASATMGDRIRNAIQSKRGTAKSGELQNVAIHSQTSHGPATGHSRKWFSVKGMLICIACFVLGLLVSSVIANGVIAYTIHSAISELRPEAHRISESFNRIVCVMYNFGCFSSGNPLNVVLFPPEACKQLELDCMS